MVYDRRAPQSRRLGPSRLGEGRLARVLVLGRKHGRSKRVRRGALVESSGGRGREHRHRLRSRVRCLGSGVGAHCWGAGRRHRYAARACHGQCPLRGAWARRQMGREWLVRGKKKALDPSVHRDRARPRQAGGGLRVRRSVMVGGGTSRSEEGAPTVPRAGREASDDGACPECEIS